MADRASDARHDEDIGEDGDRGPVDESAYDRPTTHADVKAAQDEFEQLLREYDGDFQAASDAHRRGEKPREKPQGGSRM